MLSWEMVKNENVGCSKLVISDGRWLKYPSKYRTSAKFSCEYNGDGVLDPNVVFIE